VIDHGVEDGAGSAAQQLLVSLDPLAHVLQRTRLAVAHGDDEVAPDEQHDVPE
jgi:hypothetical protein